jgi:hypothetical protein
MAGPGKRNFPAIDVPHDAGRATQETIRRIRERIEAIEGALITATAQAQASIAALKTTVTTTTTPSTGTTPYIAGAALTLPCAVIFQSSTTVIPADPTIPAQSFGCFGVAVSAAAGVGTVAPGQAAQVAAAGQVISLATSFTPFQPVFCAPNGQLTQTPPIGPAVIQVGVALPGAAMLVAPGPTIISGLAIDGAAVDNFLATTDTIWEFNDVPVAARRIVDFVAAAGFTMAMQDDPGNNRVVITFGATVAPTAGQLVEDAWDWMADDQLEDAWETWGDDSQANSSTVTPSAVLSLEDGWLDPDDVADDWEWWALATNEAGLRNLPSLLLNVEDGWDWSFDELAEEWESWQFDSFANSSTVVGSAFLSVEDGWFDQDDTEDDLWIRIVATTTGWNQNG